LDKLPTTIEKTYEHLLDRINSLPNRDLAYCIFGWVAFAACPLEVEVLQHALAIEPRTKQVDPSNITNERILLSICAGLVVIDSESHLKFVHYSTQEYFALQQDRLFPFIHVDFTCICLAHMSFNVSPYSNRAIHGFSKYSLLYWDFHAHKCSGSSTAKEILAFLDDKPTPLEDPFQKQRGTLFEPTYLADEVHAIKLLLADPEVDFQQLHGLCLAAYTG
ncbi:hypothetical protein EDD18DRAFT_1428276, partial [Armillaria luteobubalina]